MVKMGIFGDLIRGTDRLSEGSNGISKDFGPF